MKILPDISDPSEPIDGSVSSASRLRGRFTELVPLAPEHLGRLRSLELEAESVFRWRHGGAHPSPDEYYSSAWSDILCSFLVFNTSDRSKPRGIVTAYHADLRNGHCRIAASRLGEVRRYSLTVSRGVFLLFDYVFRGWNFHKLYLEVPEYNLGQFSSSLESLFVKEAVLTDYCYLDGRYWDLAFLSLTREHWLSERSKLERFIDGRQGAGD